MERLSMRLPAALKQLPPLSEALVAALEVIRNPRSRRTDLARVLSLDHGLTSLFLRTVNSAYYGLPRRITSLEEAIGFLGFEMVEATIFAISASKILASPIPAYMLEGGMLWEHSVAVAAGSQIIVQNRGIASVSDAYVAGLMHDVGKIVLDLAMEHNVEWPAPGDNLLEAHSWIEVERMVMGQDHAEVGAVLARSWNLPDAVVEAIACHHDPPRAQVAPALTGAVHIANAAALMAGIGLGIDGLKSTLDGAAVELLGWSASDMELLISAMQDAVKTAKEVLAIK